MAFLDKFTVIDLIKTRSSSVATIAGMALKFNIQTAGEMNYAPYVQVLINAKDKQFAIRACKESAPNAIPFSKPEGEQKYAIKVSNATIVTMLRKMVGWSDEENWNIPGLYLAEEAALVYDLNAAYKPAVRGSRGTKQQEAAITAAELEEVQE